MKNIVYLLGAGASAGTVGLFKANNRIQKDNTEKWKRVNGLPVIKQVPYEYGEWLKYFDRDFFKENILTQTSDQIKFKQAIMKLKLLQHKINTHTSFDVLAKKYFMNDDKITLRTVRNSISSFFLFTELEKPFDPRYDHFLLNFLNKQNRRLASELSIFSWNYDLQLERSYSSIFQTDLNQTRHNLNTTNLTLGNAENSWPIREGGLFCKINGDYSILKKEDAESGNTNVVTLFDNKTFHSYVVDNPFNEVHDKIIEHISKLFIEEEWETNIKFAWEVEARIQKGLITRLREAEYVVIIGYSFPLTNREVDKALLLELNPNAVIYVQDPNAKAIKQKVEKSIGIKREIIEISDFTDEFFIPDEI